MSSNRRIKTANPAFRATVRQGRDGTDFMDLVQLGKIERDWLPAYGQFMAPMVVPTGSLVGKPGPENPKAAASLSAYVGR